MNSNKILRTLSLFTIAFCAVATLFFIDFSVIADRLRAIDFEPSAEMSTLMNNLDLTGRADLIIRASHPTLEDSETFNRACGSTNPEVSILGCYTGGYIYIYDIDSSELAGIHESTLAHEFLHAAWDRLSTLDQDRLHTDLQIVYDDNFSTLEPRLSLYSTDDFFNELHSIVGTEFANLPDSLEAHYAHFFTNQDAIVAFYDAYSVKFHELRNQADALYEQIQDNQALIDAKTINYNDAFQELDTAIVDFNRRANSGYFTSQSAFQAERNTLIAKQSALETLYNEISTLTATTNTLIDEYNANIARTQRLIDSINSNTRTAPEL